MGCGCNGTPYIPTLKKKEDDEEETYEMDARSSRKLTGVEANIVAWLIVLWALAGLAAMIFSLVCIGEPGTPGQKFGGIVLAFVFGPFYWIYYLMSDSYCKVRK